MILTKTLAIVLSKTKKHFAVPAVALTALGLAATSVQANNLFGIDVSSYQGSVNWSSVYANGALLCLFIVGLVLQAWTPQTLEVRTVVLP